MLYASVDGTRLVHKCKNCSFMADEDYATSACCVMSHSVKGDSVNYKRYMTKFIKFDPTLPRVKNLVCTNAACTKDAAAENEVIYIKYDYKNLKYLYFCCHCDHFWTALNDA